MMTMMMMSTMVVMTVVIKTKAKLKTDIMWYYLNHNDEATKDGIFLSIASLQSLPKRRVLIMDLY